jgi:glycosyltransferase involved in cell wall biosynthesis
MLNVLFVLYHDFTSNSAVHVFHWANELSAQGVSCTVAVPDNPQSLSVLGTARFGVRTFEELTTGRVFPDGRGPDIVHAWTPRENVRQFCQRLRDRYSFRQFIHLEDNERHLLASALNRPWRAIAAMSAEELDAVVPPELSHPLRAEGFLQSGDGVTVIIDCLREFVPPHVPTMELWPAADGASFVPTPVNHRLRSQLGIPPHSIVLVYTGNVHSANAAEVRSLYLAVAILNREGHPAVLLRAGRDFCSFLGPDEAWARAHSIELGYKPHSEVSALLSAANVLVQPGKPGAFNNYRFPSKIPEFLAAGRPVVLPACNIGLQMVHGQDAFVLPNVDALAIVDAVLRITGDRDLYARLSSGARTFFERHMNWEKGGRALLAFYQQSSAAASAS